MVCCSVGNPCRRRGYVQYIRAWGVFFIGSLAYDFAVWELERLLSISSDSVQYSCEQGVTLSFVVYPRTS